MRGVLRWVYETPLGHLFLRSPAKGADTLLWQIQGAAGRDWQPGGYYAKRKVGRKSAQVTPGNAQELWAVSERLIQESRAA